MFPPRMKGALPMDTTLSLKDKLQQYIENMDEYQLELVRSFIATLFNIDD